MASSVVTRCATSLRLAVGRFDHFAQCPLLEKADLTELLLADLFIGRALDLFGAGLVDDMGDFIAAEFATEAAVPREPRPHPVPLIAWRTAR